ncbi:ATP-dependent helicase [Rhodanobacter denitrificans]|uniref:ATP-dependent helicase n=1 Tax=Rhodanobacter denitrificans TaxID=666685 RepID=UPI001F253A86|nr:ATP-dependent helicase [Rhodanobacter denitrificans]UJJ60449.1 ATP-dependent helicase [Rhodanobacter denitrificans]
MSHTGRRELTEEQKAVVRHETGHALVEAAPGSGKTTVLVAYLRRQVKTGGNPSAMLALMFNKSAQLSFEARLRRALGEGPVPDVRTFHSIGNRILAQLVSGGMLPREKLETSGKKADAFARRALKEAWSRAGGSFPPSQAQHQGFSQFITLVKADLRPPAEIFEESGFTADCRAYIPAFELLVQDQLRRKVIFFDDLIYRPMVFLEAHPELWSMFANRYDRIVVDEFQDINPISFFMVQGLAGTRGSVLGCGDPKQSIYAFRGGKVSLMTRHFEQVFQPCTRYPMTRTFRFGHEVAMMANNLITLSEEKGLGLVVADNSNPRTRVERVPLKNGKDSGVVELLAPYEHAGCLRNTAMLARNFSHLVPFEIELAEAGVPYHVYGREGLLFLPEIAALVCAVSLVAGRWIVEPEDRVHFIFSLLTTPSPFVSYEVLGEVAEDMEPFLEGPERANLPGMLAKAAAAMRAKNARGAQSLDERADALRLLVGGTLAHAPAATIVRAYMAHTRMRDVIERAAPSPEQATESLANLDAFVKLAERAGSIDEFLEVLGPMAAHKGDEPPVGDHVMLTTLHRSKGLEWPLVMMVGLTRGVFPSSVPDKDADEERRLCFVGITRAMERLVLYHPDDATLDRTIKELDWHHRPSDQTSASPYLFDGDHGPVQMAARLIEAGATGTIIVRQDRAMTDYMQALGVPITIQLTPEAQARQVREARVVDCGQIPKGHKPRKGEAFYHPEHGTCEVAEILYPPVYMMRRLDNDERFSSVVDRASGWVFPATLPPAV